MLSWLAVAAAITWLSCVRVRADASLRWQRPPASMCPTAETLQADTEALLGQPIFRAQGGDIQLEGSIEESSTRVYAHVVARRGTDVLGERALAAPAGQCATLRRPLALVFALLLDPRASPAGRTQQVGVQTELSAGANGGLLPRLSGTLGGGLAVRASARWSVRVHAHWLMPVRVETERGAGARFQAALAELALCPGLWQVPRRWAVRACAGVLLGALRATPRALDGPKHVSRLAAQAELEVAASKHLGARVWLELALGPSVALARPAFSLEQADGLTLAVHRPAPVGAFFRLRLIIFGG